MNIKFPNSILYPLPSKRLPKIRHQVGNVYFIEDDVDEPVYCVLAQVDNSKVTFICLENDTNRWDIPILVKDPQKISQKEFERICGTIYEKIMYIGRLESVLKIIPREK